jgi:hypothetical protein
MKHKMINSEGKLVALKSENLIDAIDEMMEEE